MATTTVIRTTSASRDEVFDFIADFTTSQQWDPGIAAAKRLGDVPVALGSRFEVRYRAGLVTLPLIYEITRYERPDRLVLSTRGLTHHGEDDVQVETTGEGTRIIWRATFGLRGPGRLLEPFLQRAFPKVADEAGDGLQTCLRGLSRRR